VKSTELISRLFHRSSGWNPSSDR